MLPCHGHIFARQSPDRLLLSTTLPRFHLMAVTGVEDDTGLSTAQGAGEIAKPHNVPLSLQAETRGRLWVCSAVMPASLRAQATVLRLTSLCTPSEAVGRAPAARGGTVNAVVTPLPVNGKAP